MKQAEALATQPDATTGWSIYNEFPGSLRGYPLVQEGRFDEFPTKLYVQNGERVYIPRGMTPVGKSDHRTFGDKLGLDLKVQPRDIKQERAMKALAHAVQFHKNGVAVAPTGFGKTVLGAVAVGAAKVPTCVIVHKQDLVDQWQEAFSKFLGLSGVPVWQGDNIPTDPIVIAMVQSICKDGRYDLELYDRFGLVLVDEVHRMAATEFRHAMPKFPAVNRIGLSATPERPDGLEFVFQAHIGGNLFEVEGLPMPPKVYMIPTGFRPITATGRQVDPKAGKMNYADQLLRENPNRNKQITENVRRLQELGRKTVVFSHTRQHLTDLADMINMDHGFYVGGMKKQDLRKAALKPLVFTTYKMGSEGTDKPWWDACVLASPLAHVKQPVGRVTREWEGKPQPMVVDFVDAHPLWQGYAGSRRKEYHQMKADMIPV